MVETNTTFAICAGNIIKIGKTLSEKQIKLGDYRVYYTSMIEIYNEFIDSLLSAKQDVENSKKRIIRCEIRAWEVYTNFKNETLNNSIYDLIRFWRYFFNKNSDYQRIDKEIRKLRKELREHLDLDIHERLDKFRTLGQKFDELESQPIIKDKILFWTALGVIVGAIYLFFK